MKQTGYTMAEVISVLALLGIISAILIPNIMSNSPSKNKMLFKKSYHETEKIVNDLINDTRFYPDETGFSYGNAYKVNNVDVVAEIVNVDGIEYVGPNKFCKAFASKVSILGAVSNNCIVNSLPTGPNEAPSFTTTNGTAWYILNWAPKLEISGDSKIVKDNQKTIIFIDVNGRNKPNCRATSYTDSANNTPTSINFNSSMGKVRDTGCKNPDRFQFNVDYNGRITIDGQVEQGYLKSTKVGK